MQGVEGWYVCGNNHLVRQSHTKPETHTAIEGPKTQQPTALLAGKDMIAVSDVTELDRDSDEEKDEE